MSDERPNTPSQPAGDPAIQENSGSQALSEALGSSFVIVKVVMFGLFIVLLGSGIFTVGPQQRAIILRFGQPVGQGKDSLLGPGLHWAFPPPIDEHVNIPFAEIQEVTSTIGWYATTPERERLGQEEPPGPSLNPALDGYVITGDGNIIHTRATLRYRVDDPLVYEFNFVNASNAVRNALNNALLYSASRYPVDAILYKDVARFKATVQERVAQLVQKENLGIVIDQCEIRTIPPRQLVMKFAEVTAAESVRAADLNRALSYANYRTNQAGATASATESTARAESARFTGAIQAEAKRFNDLYPRYQSDPALFVNYFLSSKLAQSWANADLFFLAERSTGEKRELRIQLSREQRSPTNSAPPPSQNRIE